MKLQRNMQELRVEFLRKITEIKQTMDRFNSRLDEMQGTVNEIEIRTGIQRS